ncbi:MAG: pentapeptide repeat-containing protein [Paracoccaceae bacterium]
MTPQALIDALTKPWAHGEHFESIGAVFDAPVVLDGLTLRSFDLSRARFNGGLSARGARFRGMAWLRGATVTGALDLTGASFRTDLRLDDLNAGSVTLEDTQFEGVLVLDRARLDRINARNALFLANLSMAQAHIAQHTDLTGATVMGGLWAEGATLHGLTLEAAEIDGRQRGI